MNHINTYILEKLKISKPTKVEYTLFPETKKELVRTTIAKGLSEILEVDYETVYNNTDKNSYYVIVKKRLYESF